MQTKRTSTPAARRGLAARTRPGGAAQPSRRPSIPRPKAQPSRRPSIPRRKAQPKPSGLSGLLARVRPGSTSKGKSGKSGRAAALTGALSGLASRSSSKRSGSRVPGGKGPLVGLAAGAGVGAAALLKRRRGGQQTPEASAETTVDGTPTATVSPGASPSPAA